MTALTALLHREVSGIGQHIDVSLHASSNVTTEFATYGWLSAQQEAQRQTGRHAAHRPTDDTQVLCADGKYLNTGVPPRRPDEFKVLYEWLVELDLLDEFPLSELLQLGSEYEHIGIQQIQEDPLVGEIFGAGRDAAALIASKLTAYDAFVGFQSRGIPVGAVYSPEEVMTDPHFLERGFPTEVDHDDIGRTVLYPGAPYRLTGSPWRISRRAPHLGEHNDDVFGELTS